MRASLSTLFRAFVVLLAGSSILTACDKPPSTPRSATVADEATDAAARGLMVCLIATRQRFELELTVPPKDFERIIASACLQEKSDFRTNSVTYFIRIGVRDGAVISNKISEQVTKLEQITVGKYTEAFYAKK